MTTPRDLITAAYAKSLKNKAGTIATEATELTNLVDRIFRSIFMGAARVNPYFFGDTEDVALAGDGWARPTAAQLISRIEILSVPDFAAGREVVVVPIDQRNAEPGKPAVFRFAQVFRPVSASATESPIAPQSGTLRFYFARGPETALIDETIDALWPESFNDLVILRIAKYLAIKDGRAEEVSGLDSELAVIAQQFIAFLEHETANERRAYGHVARFNAPSIVPVMSLLTGTAKDAA